MNLLKIKDNSTNDKNEFVGIKNLTGKIVNKSLSMLEKEGIFVFHNTLKDTIDITEKQIVLEMMDDRYKTGNLMGFIGYNNEHLIIESRFSNNDKDYLLEYLLSKVIDMPNIFDLKTNSEKEDWVINLLIFIFPYYLKYAMRKGLYKSYIRNEYNDFNVRGMIDIHRHIISNTPFIGKIAYSKREYTYDNYVIELIRHTIEYIKQKSYGTMILSKVKDEKELIVSATSNYKWQDRAKLIDINKKNFVKHAYYKEYMYLQKLCLMILQKECHSVGTKPRQIYGALFDGAWLWEEYVNKIIGDCFYHPQNKKNEGKQYLFTKGKNKVGEIYPDFISKEKDNRIIADAKYKPMENIGNKDYLQVLAYMFRFDSKLGAYIYPRANDDNDENEYLLNQGVTFDKNVVARNDILIKKIGIEIPQNSKSYTEFEESIIKEEQCFRNKIIKILTDAEVQNDYYSEKII